MVRSARVFIALLAVIALAAGAGACGSFVTFENGLDGPCFGCPGVAQFSRVYLFALAPPGTAASRATYYAYDAGSAEAGHRRFNIIKLYAKDGAAFTEYVVNGDGPKGTGTYAVRVVDQLTPHINTDGVFDTSGF